MNKLVKKLKELSNIFKQTAEFTKALDEQSKVIQPYVKKNFKYVKPHFKRFFKNSIKVLKYIHYDFGKEKFFLVSKDDNKRHLDSIENEIKCIKGNKSFLTDKIGKYQFFRVLAWYYPQYLKYLYKLAEEEPTYKDISFFDENYNWQKSLNFIHYEDTEEKIDVEEYRKFDL